MFIKNKSVIVSCMVPLLSVISFAASTGDLNLPEAVKNQDKDAVRTLLKQHADVNARQGDGATALHWAAHWDDLDTADLLIHAGANVNAATDLGVTPLYLASARGAAAMVEKLLAIGADPNLTATTGVSPLLIAARSGSVEAVQALLAHRANMNATENSMGQTALMWAVAERHPEVVRVLVMYGADIHARSRSHKLLVNISGTIGNTGGTAKDTHGSSKVMEIGGSTALLFAAREGDIECGRILVDAGANVNDTAPDGVSALVLAAHSGQGAFATFLLDKGADSNAQDAGYTALHAAVLRGNLDLVRALLAHGANPNARLANGTPARRGGPDYALSESLIGATPFLLAAKYASVDMMRVLAASGADQHLTIKDGTTSLIAAASAEHRTAGDNRKVPMGESEAFAAVKLVLDLGGDVNAANQAGNTALHIAAGRGFDTVIQLLADSGAKLDVKNGRGQTPFAITLIRPKGNPEGQPRLQHTADLLHKLGATEHDVRKSENGAPNESKSEPPDTVLSQ